MFMQRVYKDLATRLGEVVEGWRKIRPHKLFFGMTLEHFLLRVKPFTDARDEVLDLESRLASAVFKRDAASPAVLELIQGVVDSVKGDPAEGPNGELYAAMGYVPKNQRSTGLTRRGKAAAPAQSGNG
jgi:hypothetical protein